MNDINSPSVLKGWWHIVLVLLVSALLLLVVRTFLFMQVVVPVQRPDLSLLAGDRVAVNRVSYGIRMPLASWWGYLRLGKCCPQVGDIVVYDYPDGSGRVSMDRVEKLSGDTLWIQEDGRSFIVIPQGAFGVGSMVIPEQQIIGRPACVTYSVDDAQPFYKLLRPNRLFVEIR